MINSIRILTIASALLSMSMPVSAAEEYEMLISGDSATDTLELKAGESARLVYAQYGTEKNFWGGAPLWNPMGVRFSLTIRGKTLFLSAADNQDGNRPGHGIGGVAPIVIPGPSTVQVERAFGDTALSIATFAVTRIGTASPPAEVPQEAGSNFDVVLEQSSDLVNWTPANPGTYSGTETKRFFRTRIVKKQ
jgi:hypothetical protein